MKLLMQQHDHLNPLDILKRALYLKYPDVIRFYSDLVPKREI